MWTDARVLQGAYNRGDSFQSVYARLNSASSFDAYKDSLTTNPQLSVGVSRQTDFYADQSTSLTTLITTLGYSVAFLMAVGAVFGAFNTMYSSVSTRTREIATLRALGFGSGAVVAAVMLESVVLVARGRGGRRGHRICRIQRVSRGDHELAKLQPDHVRFPGDPAAAPSGDGLGDTDRPHRGAVAGPAGLMDADRGRAARPLACQIVDNWLGKRPSMWDALSA